MTEAEALDEAAKAAGWLDWKDACHLAERGEIEVICVHAKTLMENAALKAENKRLTAILAELNDTDIVARTMVDNAALEAKLAVAREALEEIADVGDDVDCSDCKASGVSARAALKEIEGD